MSSTPDPTLEVGNDIQRYSVFGEAFPDISMTLILFRSFRDCHRLSSLEVKGCKLVDCFKVNRDSLVTDDHREKVLLAQISNLGSFQLCLFIQSMIC